MLSWVKFSESSKELMLPSDLFLLGGFLGVLKEDLENSGILCEQSARLEHQRLKRFIGGVYHFFVYWPLLSRRLVFYLYELAP